ncbi:MAG TPA: ethylbenzene dehydrogenase-related protein [Desulfuromonadaceae bacterium]
MKRLTFFISLIVLVCVGSAFAAGKGDSLIVAKKVSKDPVDVTSTEWGSAKEAVLINDGASGGPFEKKTLEVKVKAVYTKGGNISMLLSWPDSDQNVSKEPWKFSKGKWTKSKEDEDKLAINWEIKRIKNFATKGCTVVCHSESKNHEDWKYHTDTATERGDIWEWKAQTSGALGYAEDGYVDDDSRKGDAGTGKAKKNESSDKKKPKFVQDPAKKASVPGALMEGETVELKNAKEGDVVPSWILSKFSGSMADVKAKAKWANGRWNLMLQRKLETSDKENDVQFDTRKEFNLGIAVFNNSSRHNSYNSGPLKVKFD